MTDAPEQVLRSRVVFEGRVVRVRVDEVRLRSGKVTTREVVEHRGAVGMVPLTADGRVLMVRQYRTALGGWTVEIPAGSLEPGEAPEACVQRELAEEVGYEAGRVEHLVTFAPSPGFLTELLHLYLCTDLRPRSLPREEEEMEVVAVPLAEARRMVQSGEIRDAKSIIGLLLAWERDAGGR
ncbi:MAG: NUDIX hydrolase [Armatimonadota bacterium]|nr:NUDIX hydrolase [Armatimonadota bacterium]MDW8155752.1 NUDIX hydrolase [Armatimonadota bacterium]